MTDPSRGEVWLASLDPIRGHEQAGTRPCLVYSVDPFNHGPAGLSVVLPITSKGKKHPFLVEINPPEGGVRGQSFVMCYAIRSLSHDRFLKKWGQVSQETLDQAADRLRDLFDENPS